MVEYLGGAVTIVDVVEKRGAVVDVDVVAGIGDIEGVLNGGVDLEDLCADVVLHGGAHALGMPVVRRTDACFPLDDDATFTLYGGADAQPDVVGLAVFLPMLNIRLPHRCLPSPILKMVLLFARLLVLPIILFLAFHL